MKFDCLAGRGEASNDEVAHANINLQAESVGVDETNGRYADVTLERCLSCGRVWLRYFVEYEGISRSGRWARGEINERQAKEVTPDTALDILEGLASYVRGGSRFNGVVSTHQGKMAWGI
jgi:hypothetical protein